MDDTDESRRPRRQPVTAAEARRRRRRSPRTFPLLSALAVIVVLGFAPIFHRASAGAEHQGSASRDPVIQQYDVFEETFAIDSTGYANPWRDVDLAVTVFPPAGTPARIGGFYDGRGVWKVRLAPWAAGRWSWTAVAHDRSRRLFSRSGTFQVLESHREGFVRRDPANPFRLVFDDGTLFPAIGIGDCVSDADRAAGPPDRWGLDGSVRAASSRHGRIVDIDTYLRTYAQAGFNLFRWSVDNCAFRLWDTISPDGNRYLEREGRWGDALAKRLRRHGFRIYLVLFNQPPFARDSGDAAAMDAIRHYIRYVADRYGAYVDVWELMNESVADDAWYSAAVGALRAADPYHHLISTSSARPQDPLIDVASPHWYERESEFASDDVTAHHIKPWKRFRKPIVFGEQGNLGANWDARSAIRMRLRSWSAFFNEGILIFWNTSAFKGYSQNLYIGPEERRYIRALQAFVRTFPPDIEPIPVRVSQPARVRGYGLRSKSVLAAYLTNFADHGKPTAGLSLSVVSPVRGTATWYDPSTGSAVSRAAVSTGPVTLRVPPFVVDIAMKITRGTAAAGRSL